MLGFPRIALWESVYYNLPVSFFGHHVISSHDISYSQRRWSWYSSKTVYKYATSRLSYFVWKNDQLTTMLVPVLGSNHATRPYDSQYLGRYRYLTHGNFVYFEIMVLKLSRTYVNCIHRTNKLSDVRGAPVQTSQLEVVGVRWRC